MDLPGGMIRYFCFAETSNAFTVSFSKLLFKLFHIMSLEGPDIGNNHGIGSGIREDGEGLIERLGEVADGLEGPPFAAGVGQIPVGQHRFAGSGRV